MSERPAILGGEPIRPQGPPEWPPRNPAIRDALLSAWQDGSWGRYDGRHCRELIEQLAEHHQTEHVILCSSGTVAVELALRGVGVGSGDDVLLAAYDFKANFQNVLTIGANPLLHDIRHDDWQFDVQSLECIEMPQSTAVLVSHLHGGVVDMPALRRWADRQKIKVIEDACQMPGAQLFGRTAGTWGDVGVISFGGSKTLSAGRGGAVLTNDATIAQRTRLYTQRGNNAYPLSELQAAVLLPQLRSLDHNRQRRLDNANTLRESFATSSGLRAFKLKADCEPDYYKLGIQYDPETFGGLSRDRFSAAMRAEGIAMDPGFRSLHRIHSRRRFRTVGDLPEADRADTNVLVLHHPVLLEDNAALQEIISATERIREFAGEIAK
ncbi:DegT/DnrJ/EryC1/StrS family aminotransferase [Thalassoroseus pseudoceratinae]|uniref:DegT/DnrJ/EryC1/StrS family aminotransferase n=1 Tax=Thalassoroseus pseudoceratinae TaxID=2713176 RepID=UPI001422C292|nr:aminotransferase class V-fold PLP-dependent enzyme [Thalassoroseus pseudoceratinae]